MAPNIGKKTFRADANASAALLRTKVREIVDVITGSFQASNNEVGNVININSNTQNVYITANTFSRGDIVRIFNNTEIQVTVTQNTGVTLWYPNVTNTSAIAVSGNRILGSKGYMTLTAVGPNIFVVSGVGIS